MPSPNCPATDLVDTDLQREPNKKKYDHGNLTTIIMNSEPLLTAEKKIIFDRIMLDVAAEQGGIFFLDSPGGTDAANWYVAEMTARVVAKSGIAEDRFHLGKLIFQGLQDAPGFIMQIDGATGKTETFGSVLKRSTACAIALLKLGIDVGDNVIIMAPNHLDVTVPFYAALYLGLGIGCIDMTLGINELCDQFMCELPKVVFCQNEKAEDVTNALKMAKLKCHIIVFDETDQYTTLYHFLQGIDESSIMNFKPMNFNTDKTVAFLIATSGTTGLSKAAEITHKNIALSFPHWWKTFVTFPTPTRLWLLPSPIQWISAVLVYIQSPIMRITRLQSSLQMTVDHIIELINQYKPTYLVLNPNLLTALLNPELQSQCDFTCFELITVGGSAVPQSLLDKFKAVSPYTRVSIGYGMSEISGLCFMNYSMIPNICGQVLGCTFMRLVDPFTEKEVTEPNISGELWLKGPTIFKGYCNNPALTKESFSDDGWLKTGDVFCRDENLNFIFVDRLKILLKYKNHQISPVEIEDVIRLHPGVAEVAVTGIPHPEDGDLPVACIVTLNSHKVTAEEIHDLVEVSLTDTKRLRGGVIFFEELPLTNSSKINRAKLKEIAQQRIKEQSC